MIKLAIFYLVPFGRGRYAENLLIIDRRFDGLGTILSRGHKNRIRFAFMGF